MCGLSLVVAMGATLHVTVPGLLVTVGSLLAEQALGTQASAAAACGLSN